MGCAGLGGAIDIATKLGTGSTFVVYLPRSGDAPQLPSQPESTQQRGRRQRVLIVDDEESLVRLTAETLEGLGYATASFTSSLAAFEAFRDDPRGFDAVVTDERMPFMSGSTLTREIRAINKTVPVLLVSGNLSAAAIAEANRAGVSQILKKAGAHARLFGVAELLSQS